jgi:peptidoglycan hydrolase-like protein with peptidoglycan-binding domain
VVLTIPTGFTSTPGTISFQAKQLDKDDFFTAVSAPTGLTSVGGFVYNFKVLVDATTVISSFDQPIVVTFSYDPAALGSTPASSLVIYRYNGSSWNALSNCTIDTDAHTVSCETSAFSDFAIFGTQSDDSGSRSGSRRNGGSIRLMASPSPLIATAVAASQSSFVRDLTLGSTGEDVRALQKYLNGNGYTVAQSGPGSLGQETLIFGFATQAALARYQTARGLTPAVGYFGPKTRASIVGTPDISVPTTKPNESSQKSTGSVYTRDLTLGSTGEDVKALQKFLNANGYLVAERGVGSPGNETLIFGYATEAALARYQADHNLSPAVGYFGPLTRTHIQSR